MDTGQTSSPVEEEGEGQGSFVSFSKEKETMDRATSPPRHRPRCGSLCPPILLLPPCSPSGTLIHPCLFWERRGRGQGSSTSFSKEEETNDHPAPLSSVPSSSLFPPSSPFSSLLSYVSTPPATHPPPPPRCVYCWVARWVDCCVYFDSSVPSRAFRVRRLAAGARHSQLYRGRCQWCSVRLARQWFC